MLRSLRPCALTGSHGDLLGDHPAPDDGQPCAQAVAHSAAHRHAIGVLEAAKAPLTSDCGSNCHLGTAAPTQHADGVNRT